MRQRLGVLTGLTVAYVGDYANVARSLAEISLLLGMHVRLGCPRGFDADEAELERLSMIGTGTIVQVTSAADAVDGAHAVHTDTWVSMGQENEKAARRRGVRGLHGRRRHHGGCGARAPSSCTACPRIGASK